MQRSVATGARDLGIGSMQRHRRVELLAQSRDAAEVVEVAVGEKDERDVLRACPVLLQGREDAAGHARVASVHDDRALALDEIGVRKPQGARETGTMLGLELPTAMATRG